jgi:hypothetical protein
MQHEGCTSWSHFGCGSTMPWIITTTTQPTLINKFWENIIKFVAKPRYIAVQTTLFITCNYIRTIVHHPPSSNGSTVAHSTWFSNLILVWVTDLFLTWHTNSEAWWSLSSLFSVSSLSFKLLGSYCPSSCLVLHIESCILLVLILQAYALLLPLWHVPWLQWIIVCRFVLIVEVRGGGGLSWCLLLLHLCLPYNLYFYAGNVLGNARIGVRWRHTLLLLWNPNDGSDNGGWMGVSQWYGTNPASILLSKITAESHIVFWVFGGWP